MVVGGWSPWGHQEREKDVVGLLLLLLLLLMEIINQIQRRIVLFMRTHGFMELFRLVVCSSVATEQDVDAEEVEFVPDT